MTTNQTIDGVPRELRPVLAMILNALDRDAADGKAARGEMASELRALLGAPGGAASCSNSQRYLRIRDEADRDYVEFGGKWYESGCDLDAAIDALDPAAQPHGEPVGFRYRAHGGAWELMGESPFADGRTHYNEGGEQLEPVYAMKPQGEPVAWLGSGIPFSRHKDAIEYASYKDKLVIPLYAEQPAPVAVVIPERKHVPDFRQHPMLNKEYTGWNACLDELKRLNPAL